MSNRKRWFSALLAVLLILSVGFPNMAFAAGSAQSGPMYGTDPASVDSDYDGIPDEFDAAPGSNVFTGQLKSGHDGTTAVSYTVDYRVFFDDNTVYDPDLASLSVMGAALAYYEADYSDAYFTFDTAQNWAGGTATKVEGRQLMQVLGFEDVVDYSLDAYADDDLCEVLLGHRTVTYGDETVVIVAIWVRGTDSTSVEEWSSNFHMGDLVRFFDAYDSVAGKSPRQSNDDWTRKTNHRGFDVCATRLLRYLDEYYLTPYVQPALDAAPGAALTYWLTGHSRGAAVANLMASYLIDRGDRVFAYTFAAPYNTANTEASAEKYDCIFNLVNANDFIPMLPMPEWGFTRYGRTATVDASAYASQIKSATGQDYSGKYLSTSEMSDLLGKFICITGENSSRSNPGKILGWREVYVYHCGHEHEGETVGSYQSTTFVKKQSITNWGGPSESSYNGYATRLRKYSYWHDGICETPAYDLQVLVELLVQVAQGNTLSGGWDYLSSNKLADKFDFNKQSLVKYANQLTEPHFMDTYSVIQAQINAAGGPGALFRTLPYYTADNTDGGRPSHTHSYTYVPYEGQEPTCTEDGLGYRYCLCSEADADYYDDYQKNVVIPAFGHDWGEPVWTWNEDNTEASVLFTCANDASHTEEIAAEITEEVLSPTSDGQVSVIRTATVTGPDGNTYSDAREMVVLAVTRQPADMSGYLNEKVTFTAEAEGKDLSYMWQCYTGGKWIDTTFAGSKTNHLTVTVTEARNGRLYRCVITDANGNSVNSEPATLIMLPNTVTIVKQPTNAAAVPNSSVTFTVEADGEGLTYMWQCYTGGKWIDTKFATSRTAALTVKATAVRDGRQYRCVVTDVYGHTATSEPATLTVISKLVRIVKQPTDGSGTLNSFVAFEVKAEGDGLTYMWQCYTGGKWVNTNFNGSKTPELIVKVTQVRDGRQYRCVVTDAYDQIVISDPATLHVATSGAQNGLCLAGRYAQ